MAEVVGQARLPNELTDAVIDHLDFASLLNAALVARSWRTRATVRLFVRLEIWSGGSRTCERSRLPRGVVARMPCAVLLELLDRDTDVFRSVRELHVVFSGGRLESEARRDADAMLEVLTRLPLGEIEHLAIYSFPNNLGAPFNALLRACTALRSLHLIDLQSVESGTLLSSLNCTRNVHTIAVLGGALHSEENIQLLTFAAQVHAHVASCMFPQSSQVFLAPDRLEDLLAWTLHAPRLSRCLNVVGVRAFTWGVTLDELFLSHTTQELGSIMSCVNSLELTVDYEDKLLRLVRILHAFPHIPVLQLTFESHPANLALVVHLLQKTELDWSRLQCLVVAPRPSSVPAEWSLLDDGILEMGHFVSLRSVVVYLTGSFSADAVGGIIQHLPKLRDSGILRVMRRPPDATHHLFLPFVAQRFAVAD
ncbi:hypothetical protein AURDEDRAFT_164970 [Auricularia subglabra TFB-10046 SS5]|nr:hypothetical protein AURDEDRAFT_164970 [Auricularia subglabra TFB-10046 SS5]